MSSISRSQIACAMPGYVHSRAAGSGYHPSGRILILDGYRAVLVAICQKEARSAVRLSVLLATERRAPGNS